MRLLSPFKSLCQLLLVLLLLSPPSPVVGDAAVVDRYVRVNFTSPITWNTARHRVRLLVCRTSLCLGYHTNQDVVSIASEAALSASWRIAFNDTSVLFDLLGLPPLLLFTENISSVEVFPALPSVSERGVANLLRLVRRGGLRSPGSSMQDIHEPFVAFRHAVLTELFPTWNPRHMMLVDASYEVHQSGDISVKYVFGFPAPGHQIEFNGVDWVFAQQFATVPQLRIVETALYPIPDADLDLSTTRSMVNRAGFQVVNRGPPLLTFAIVAQSIEHAAAAAVAAAAASEPATGPFGFRGETGVAIPQGAQQLVSSRMVSQTDTSANHSFVVSFQTQSQQSFAIRLAEWGHLVLPPGANVTEAHESPSPADDNDPSGKPPRSFGRGTGGLVAGIVLGMLLVAALIVMFIKSNSRGAREEEYVVMSSLPDEAVEMQGGSPPYRTDTFRIPAGTAVDAVGGTALTAPRP